VKIYEKFPSYLKQQVTVLHQCPQSVNNDLSRCLVILRSDEHPATCYYIIINIIAGRNGRFCMRILIHTTFYIADGLFIFLHTAAY